MGKRGGNRFSRGGRGKGRGGGGGGSERRTPVRAEYNEVNKTNELFVKNYNTLALVPEHEQPEFWAALKRELPNSFRFTGSKGHALPVQQLLKTRYIPEITAIDYEGQPVAPPFPLPWYPDQLAWQMTTPKNVVRRFPPFSSFQKFLVSETSVGNISRQEAVSMIPPLLLDVKPGMTVLDLCAAPGSKSAQLIEMVHRGEEARSRIAVRKILAQEGRELSPDGNEIKLELEGEELADDWEDDGRATGLLIANDVDYKRAHMLIHQMKRLNSPNLMVTNHDATNFPSIKLPSDSAAEDGGRNRYLKFDRILADVPCSGDGTTRKNLNVWKDWSPVNGLGLHITQVRILVRSLQMLKVGGRVVYSTCSMNPVENEAVVAAAIDRCGGTNKVEVIDCSSKLPELKRRPGLKSWEIMDKTGRMWPDWEAVEKQRAEGSEAGLAKLTPGMFPPNESHGIPLDRCMRVYAHDQDTGAFFITVLEKKTEIKPRPEDSKPQVSKPKAEPAPVASVAPITAIVGELESKSGNLGEHIEALDAIVPSEIAKDDDPSATARQNQENMDKMETDPKKHQLDDEADALASTKRPKFREEIDAVAERGEEEPRHHDPPPPAAELTESQARPSAPLPPQKAGGRQHQFEEPFKYLDPDHEALRTIYEFYNLNSRFPRDRFMVRNAQGTATKTIYYTSTLARDILVENEGKGLKFVHCGIKMFVRQDVQSEEVCRWRTQSEGLPLLEAWVGDERIIRLNSRKTFRSLLQEMFPKVTGGGWEDLGEIGQRALDISMGCCLLRIEKGEGEDSFSERMVLPIWRSMHSLNLMLPKEDRKAMLLRLYNDTTPLMDHSKDRFKKIEDETPTANDEDENMTDIKDEPVANVGDAVSVDDEDGGVKLEKEEADLEVDLAVGTKDT